MTVPSHTHPTPRPMPRGRPVTISGSAPGVNPAFITSPCRLLGWSVNPAAQGDAAIAASLQGVAAAAGTLTMTGFFAVSSVVVTPAGAWPAVAGVVTVNNVTGGPIIAQIPQGTVNPVVITFAPSIGVTGTPTAVVPALVGGPAYTIEATGLSSAAAAAVVGVIAQLVDGGQVVGSIATTPNTSDTEQLPEGGIYVGTSLALNLIQGTLTGVVYIADNWHGGDN